MPGHRASGLTHSVGATAPPEGSRPGARRRSMVIAASKASSVALLRFSAFSWRIASPGRDTDRDQCEKGGLDAGKRLSLTVELSIP